MKKILFVILLLSTHLNLLSAEITMLINKDYLNFPISNMQEREKMDFYPA